MWILERCFHPDFGKREYGEINAVSENKIENIKLIVEDVNEIGNQIIVKFSRFRERHK